MSQAFTNDGDIVFMAAVARAIFEIDGPPPRLTTPTFLNRIRQHVLVPQSAGQCSSQAEKEGLERYDELMTLVLSMRNWFSPKESLQDPPLVLQRRIAKYGA